MEKSILAKENLHLYEDEVEDLALEKWKNMFHLPPQEIKEPVDDFYNRVQSDISYYGNQPGANFKEVVNRAVRSWQKVCHYIEDISYVPYDRLRRFLGPNYGTFILSAYCLEKLKDESFNRTIFTKNIIKQWQTMCGYPVNVYGIDFDTIRDLLDDANSFRYVVDYINDIALGNPKLSIETLAGKGLFAWQENLGHSGDIRGLNLQPLYPLVRDVLIVQGK
jgi:hypothetical protein